MFAWYADVGYYSLPSLNGLTNISQINFLDYKRPFGFYTAKDEYIGGTGAVGQNYEVVLSFLNDRCGDEINRLYGATQVSNYYPESPYCFDKMLIVIPSMDLSCPNLFTFSRENRGGNVKPTCLYFKSLRRLVVDYSIYDAGSNVQQIFVVDDDGSLTLSSRNGFGFFRVGFNAGGNDGGIYMLWFLKPGVDSSGITDANNYAFRLNASYSLTTGYYARTNSVDTFDLQSMLDSFFGYSSKPDVILTSPPNPYYPANPSGPGTLPPGTFDDTSDPIPLPSLPSLSAANTGFTRIYNPTLAQVQSLARYLWTDESVVSTIWNHIKQYFEDPMQAMIGFNLVPVPVPDAGSEEFALMYLGTGVYMNVAANQFVDVDCGSLELERYYGSALDQSPYTKVHAYLPYIGTVQLDTDEVMGTTLTVNYRVDIVSGSCVASILVDGNVLYQYSGHCAITIPFSSADFSSYVNAAIQVAKLGIAAGANAGMAALASANQEAQQETGRVVTRTTETRNTTRNPTTGRQITRSTQTVVSTTQYPPEESKSETKASFAGLSPANISNTVGQIMSSKPNILHSGSFSGNSGYLGVRRPYLIIERPNMCLPESFQSMNGYPSMITMVLGECVGYTRVQQVQLTGMWATNPEQAEILQLLKSGVIF